MFKISGYFLNKKLNKKFEQKQKKIEKRAKTVTIFLFKDQLY